MSKVFSSLPILPLTIAERRWLENIYQRNLHGERFSCREVWTDLYKKIPDRFHPSEMDSRLIEPDGEAIKMLGVIALKKNRTILKKADKIILYVRKQLISDPSLKEIVLDQISKETGIAINEIYLVLKLSQEFGLFYRSTSSNNNSLQFNKMSIEGDGNIFYNYMRYPGMENLIEQKMIRDHSQVSVYFTTEEQTALEYKIDRLVDEIQLLNKGQEFVYTELMEALEEMKQQFQLSKKNWFQLLRGKLGELILSGLMDELISKRIADVFNPRIDQIFKMLNQ